MNFNDSIIAEFRENDGSVQQFGGRTLLLLHTIGAKSGEPRISPVMYFDLPEGLFVVASKAGAPEHPAWYHNLLARPTVTVEQATPHGIETFEATAEVVDDSRREELYSLIVEKAPGFGAYQQKTDRIIPIVQLRRTEGAGS